MRKLIMWNMVTVDGYFEGEKEWDLDFHKAAWGNELVDFSIDQLKSADMLIFGKNTYRGMADYWPKAEGEGEVKELMNEIRKVVCSSTITSSDWNNTTITSDAISEISRLKTEGNGDMLVFGSGKLCISLMEADLFDEYRICIAPVLLGKGRRLFPDGISYKKLKLIDSRSLSTGAAILKYTPEKTI